MTITLHTAVYLRVSTSDKQEHGLSTQQLALQNYCSAKGYTSVKFYSDKMSGTTTTRPGLDALILDCDSGIVDRVLVFSFSRFGRSLKHLIESMEYFNSKNIGFISLNENLDTTTSVGRMMFAIISALAQWEREQISIRVKAGMENAKARGKQIGARKKHTNDAIFLEMKNKGYTTRQIAKLLKCSPATVVRILKGTKSQPQANETFS